MRYVTDETNTNQETTETSAPEEAAAVVEPQDQESAPEVDIPLRDQLTRKAARFLDESDYTEDEYADMLNMYDTTMKSFELGNIVEGRILHVTDDTVIVDIGFKSEGVIPIQEFGNKADLAEGDEVEVYLDDFENQEGQLVLSKQKADFMRVWDKIKDAYDNNEEIEGRMVRRIKGGIVVNLLGVEGFLPGSQIDIRQVRDFDQYIGQMTNLKIIKLNKARRNIVVSRRAVLEEERGKMRDQVLSELEIGQVREGTVKNITDFGAFIDLGGVDGLLHITDMSWGRISHPSELVSIGDKIQVQVLNYEDGKTRISLGTKQLTAYPWEGVDERYPVGNTVDGKVVSTTDYGVFVELEHGVEGLVHISEMSWTHPPKHPSKMFKVGDAIKVQVLNVNKPEEKISLGIKQLTPDPWQSIDERNPVGSRVEGKVRNLTNFGAFVEIEEGIDGLVHISDMSWTKRIKHPSEVMKKSQVVEVVILDIDKNNRRISLGHKQIFEDPWETLERNCEIGTTTNGTIIRILDRGVVVALDDDVEGFVPAFQLGEGVKKPAEAFNVGDELPLKVIEFDKGQRKIILSVREFFKDKDRNEFDSFRDKYKPRQTTIMDAIDNIADVMEAVRDKVPSETEETVKKTPVKKTPEEAPVAEAPVEDTPVEEAPEEVVEAPEDAPAEEAPVKEAPEEVVEAVEAVEAVEEVAEEVSADASDDAGDDDTSDDEAAEK
jgi:small subunit ribosomal protein S1